MNGSSRRSTAAHFKQRCRSGVEGKLLMPALQTALRESVPWTNLDLVWLDGEGRVMDGYTARPCSFEVASIFSRVVSDFGRA